MADMRGLCIRAPLGDEILQIVEQRIEAVEVGQTLRSATSRPDPPCPRQSKPSTRQPARCQQSMASRCFSMKSARPPRKRRLPRGRSRGARVKLRSAQPSRARHSAKCKSGGMVRLGVASTLLTTIAQNYLALSFLRSMRRFCDEMESVFVHEL
jgi:hypothetical protein